eukprot:1580998-Amphidinium_carterae.1
MQANNQASATVLESMHTYELATLFSVLVGVVLFLSAGQLLKHEVSFMWQVLSRAWNRRRCMYTKVDQKNKNHCLQPFRTAIKFTSEVPQSVWNH